MALKSRYLLIILLVIFLVLPGISANENVTCNFTQLTDEINAGDAHLELTDNYTQVPDEQGINISQSIDIEGNDFTVASNDSIEFVVTSDNLSIVFKNINFQSRNGVFFNLNNSYSPSITLIDCNYSNQSMIPVEYVDDSWGYGCTCNVTDEIKTLAESIVGKKTGLEAAQMLTVWVAKNIKYEHEAGFYQTPAETLSRKKGNCCCQSELLVHMMEAVGITKNHNISFVHVGLNKFKYRHYFIMIDNILADPTYKYPWGHAAFKNRTVMQIVDYPILPLPRGLSR